MFGVWLISGLKTTAHKVFRWRTYRICFTKSSPSPPLQWVATEDGGTAPEMTKGRWSALQIHRSVDDVADICARKTPCCPIWTGETLLNWIGGQNQWKNDSKSHDSAGAWKIFHGKYGEQLVPKISVFSCFKNKGGRDNNKPLHGYMYFCGIKWYMLIYLFPTSGWL